MKQKNKQKQKNFWMIATLILMLLILIYVVADYFRGQKQNSEQNSTTYTIPNVGTFLSDDLNYVSDKLNTKTLTVCNMETKVCKQVTRLK